jgi:hypothetical protein
MHGSPGITEHCVDSPHGGIDVHSFRSPHREFLPRDPRPKAHHRAAPLEPFPIWLTIFAVDEICRASERRISTREEVMALHKLLKVKPTRFKESDLAKQGRDFRKQLLDRIEVKTVCIIRKLI